MDPVKNQLREANDLLVRLHRNCKCCREDAAHESLAIDLDAYLLEHNLIGADGEENVP